MKPPLIIHFYFDYVCPWSYIAAARLQRVSEAHSRRTVISWQGFPMVPGLGGSRLSLSDINRSRERAAIEAPDLAFSPWPNIPPPSGSMPALEAGRCAQYQGGEPYKQFHFSLFRAYFEENRDISRRAILVDIGKHAGLDAMRLEEDLERGQARAELESEKSTLMAKGTFTGVPTVFFGKSHPFIGAMPVQVYQRAVERIEL